MSLRSSALARTLALFAVPLAFGGIVLARAENHRAAPPAPRRTTTTVAQSKSVHDDDQAADPSRGTRLRFSGPGLTGEIGLSQSAVPVGGERHVYAEISLSGDGDGARVPAAISVVVDKSGSMDGEKIVQARRALLALLDRMDEDDYISVVTYSDSAHVMESFSRVGDVEERLRARVSRISADGGTNIRSGLVLGATQLEGAPRNAVRRILLLSDGQDTYGANATRSANAAVEESDGATISTLGIGHDFDERFMRNVAEVGQGNYAFLANTNRMRDFMSAELEQTRSTTADDVRVELRLPDGWRVARAFGTEIDSRTGRVSVDVGAITSTRERRIVLDLAVDADEVGSLGALAANVRYTDTAAHAERSISAEGLSLRAVRSEEEAHASRDNTVYARSRGVELADQQTQAVEAWRQGRRDEASRIANQAAAEARDLAATAPAAAPMLNSLEREAADQAVQYQQIAPSSAAGASYGRRAAARSNANTRGMSADDAAY